MAKPSESPKKLPPLWRDVVKFFVVLATLFLLLLAALSIAALIPGLIPPEAS